MRTWIRSTFEPAGDRPGGPVLVLLAVGVVLLGVMLADGAGARGVAGPVGTDKQAIATATSNGLRVRLVAFRDPSEDPPLATVRISAFERSAGEWRRLGRPQVVGGKSAWFWRVVTHRFGVNRLALRMSGGRFPLRVRVRLLQSPSLGASAGFLFAVADGRLVAIDV